MVENLLTEALRKLVAEAVKDYVLPVENGKERAPQVINGYLPPKRSGVHDDFPFVVVRAENGKNEADRMEMTVAIIIGCYTKEVTGHEYCINIMQRIRTALVNLPNGLLDSRYLLNYPIEWTILAEQPYPQWQLDMTTRWSFRTPEMPFND